MSKILGPTLQMESWARFLGGCIFPCSRGNCIFFSNFHFDMFWNCRNLAMYQSFKKRIWFKIIFLQALFYSRYIIFCDTITFFAPFEVIENRFIKINFKYFNRNCDYFSCPGWSILFIYAPVNNGLGFWKNHVCAILSLS